MPLFQDDYLYFTFVSDDGCTLSLSFSETEPKAKKMRLELAQYKQKLEEDTRKALYDYNEDEDPYFQLMLQENQDVELMS